MKNKNKYKVEKKTSVRFIHLVPNDVPAGARRVLQLCLLNVRACALKTFTLSSFRISFFLFSSQTGVSTCSVLTQTSFNDGVGITGSTGRHLSRRHRRRPLQVRPDTRRPHRRRNETGVEQSDRPWLQMGRISR